MRFRPFLVLVPAVAGVLALPAPAGAPSTLLAARNPVAEKAAVWAAKQEGVTEIGDTNCGKTVERWQRNAGLKIPPCHVWCGIFVHEAFLQAGIKLSIRWIDPEKVLVDAENKRRHLRLIRARDLRRGDVALMLYRNDKRASHASIVLSHRAGSNYVTTAEGNAGDAVVIKRHHISFFVGALRVDPKTP